MDQYFPGQGNVIVDPEVTVTTSGGNSIDAARVIVFTNYNSATDIFSINGNTSGSLTANINFSFDAARGILNLNGQDSAANYEAALRQVAFLSTASANVNKDVAMSLGPLLPFRGTDHDTFHFYEYVNAPGITWIAADVAANARFYQNTVPGYLMTLTTEPENTFALTKFQQNAWVGASDRNVEDEWRWITGPEGLEDGGLGRYFWDDSNGTGMSVNGHYSNWAGGEPNDWGSGEDYAHFWVNAGGLWNDFRVNNGSIGGYLVEYGSDNVTIPFVGNVQTSVIPTRPPQSITFNSFFIFGIDENLPLNGGDLIGTVTAADPDVTDGNPFENLTISLASPVLYPDNGIFSFDGATLSLTSNTIFDYEGQNTYTVAFTASDNFGNSITRDFNISINDINESPIITPTTLSGNIDEDGGLINFTFIIEDPESSPAALFALLPPPTSSNTSLLANANIIPSLSGNVLTLGMTPTDNGYGETSILLTLTDGVSASATNTLTLSVNAVNDAPIHFNVTDETSPEDNPVVFNGAQALGISDIDLGSGNAEVTLVADVGTITLSQTSGLVFTAGNGSSNSLLTFTGNTADVNAALNGLTYTPPENFFGTDNLQWLTSDQGGFGSGGSLSDQSTIQITLNSVNDAPFLNVAANLNFSSILEDSTPGSGNSWSEMRNSAPANLWEDVDPFSADSIAVVGSDNQGLGNWEYSTNGGSSWANLPSSSNNSALLLRSNTRFRFSPNTNANGNVELNLKAWDESDGSVPGAFVDAAYSPSGAFSSNSISLNQTIVAVNDAPIWSAPPSSGNTSEDTPVVQGPFTFSDVEFASSNNTIVTLTVLNGSANLSSTDFLIFTTGSGNEDSLMVFEGNTQAINNALSSILFVPDANYNGTALITVSADDQGLSGLGGAMSSNASVIVLVNQVNDAPNLNNLLDLSFSPKPEDTIDPSGNSVTEILTSISGVTAYSDIDENFPNPISLPDGIAITTWSSANGQWQMTFNGGGSWTNFPIYSGNALLLGEQFGTAIRFVPNLHFFGEEYLSIRAWDGTTDISGNVVEISATGGNLAFSDNLANLTLPIQAINDAPFIGAPGGLLNLTEEIPLSFGPSSNFLSLLDVEASSNTEALLELSLASDSGNLELAFLGGSLTGIGTNASTNVTVQGNLSDLSAAINGMLFRSHKDLTGSATMNIRFNDLDTTEPSPLEASLTLNLQINNVNDPPLLGGLSSSLTFSENTFLFLAGNALINDVDDTFVEGANIYIDRNLMALDRLSVTNSGNVSSSYNTITGELTLTGRDTLSTYQTVLRSLIFFHLGNDPDDQGSKAERDFRYLLYDSESTSIDRLQTVSVSAIADAPLISSWNATPTYSEGNTFLVLDNDVVISDGDSPNLVGLSILLTNFQSGDNLNILPSANLVLSTNTAGNLTFTGNFTLLEATQTLQSLSYQSISEEPSSLGSQTNRIFDIHLNDGGLSSNATLVLNINSINDSPTITPSSNLSVDEDNLLSIDVSNAIILDDVDGTSGTNLLLSLGVSSGNLISSGVPSSNFIFIAGLNDLQTSLGNLVYKPSGNFFGNVSFDLFLEDRGNFGNGGSQSSNVQLTISVNAINDAPLLQSTSRALTSIEEDSTDPAGNTIDEGLIQGGTDLISDADPLDPRGVAIIGQTAADGVWQYSLNGASSWFDFPVLSNTSALLLNHLAMIRFVPNPDFNGTPELTYRAWDLSDGITSGTNSIDASNTGGENPFSINTGTWSVVVAALNDSPNITVPGPIALAEDTFLSLGGSNASILADEDAGSGTNLVLSLSASSGNFLQGGLLSNPLVLTPNSLSGLQSDLDGLFYLPSGNANGSVALDLTLNDMGNTGAGGSRQVTETISVTLTPVNDAPELQTFSFNLNDIDEDESNSSGNVISDLLSPSGVFAISDPDPGSVAGVALMGTNTLSSQGRWEFSLNGGGSWAQVGTLSDNHALVLDTTAMIRFVPSIDFNGGANLFFRAWDQSSGLTSGFSGIDTSMTGGNSSFSNDVASWELEVISVNDAPLVSAPAAIFSDEDTPVIVTGFSVSDPDLNGSDIVRITVTAQDGVVSNNLGQTGGSFTVDQSIDTINGWLTAGLTYQPPADFNSVSGNITSIRVEVSDLGGSGQGGALSSTDTVSLYIGAVNDAPILDTNLWTSGVNILEDDTDHSGWTPGNFSGNNLAAITDVDSAELPLGDNVFDGYGLAFTSLGQEVEGRWEQSLNSGGNWTTVPTLGSNALLLSLDGQHRLRFVPGANANGNLSISFRGWDRSSGVAGNLENILATGGNSAYSVNLHTISLAVLPVNDAPTLSTTTLPLSVDEDTTLILSNALGNGITPWDLDLSERAELSLSLSSSLGNLQLADLNGITITSGGNDSKDLSLTGNLIALRNALEGLRYIPDPNINGSDNLFVEINDEGQIGGGNLISSVNLTVLIQAINDDPVLLGLDGDISTYLENSGNLQFDVGGDLSLADIDSTDFLNGRVVISGIDGGTRNDLLVLVSSASVNLVGSTINHSGNAIGEWTDNSDEQASVTLTFNSLEATPSIIEDVLDQIRYRNDSDIPSPSTRSFEIHVHDGDGGSTEASVRIRVTPINDDPVIGASNLLDTYFENQGSWTVFAGNLNLSDVDSEDFFDGSWAVSAESGFDDEDNWAWIPPSNYSLSGNDILYMGVTLAKLEALNSGSSIFSVTFTSTSANSSRSIEILEGLAYSNDADAPNTGERVLRVVLTDGDGGQTETLRHRFSLRSINDAPVMVMGTSMSLGALIEDTTHELGWTAAEILELEPALVSDPDGFPDTGILIRPDEDWSRAGVWETRLASGTWQELPAQPASTGILLGPLDRIRFTPSPNWFGEITDGLQIWAWDQSENFNGTFHTLSVQGGTSAYSLNSRQLDLTITAVPEPPTVSDNTIQGAKYAQRASTWEDFNGNFSDVDITDDGVGDVLQAVRIDRLPSNGNLLFNGNPISLGQTVSQANVGLLTYQPFNNYTGPDNWAWSGYDGTFYSLASANLNIDILAVTANLIILTDDVNEDASRVVFQILLSNPSTQTISLDINWISGNLIPYNDFVLNGSSIEIPAGVSTFGVNVFILDDLLVEGDENATFSLSNPNLLDLGSTITGNLIVRDNDTSIAGDLSGDDDLIVEWLDPPWVSENGDTARLSVRLTQTPASSVDISLNVSDTTEASLSSTLLNFTPGNGTTAQIITVTGLDDLLLDGPVDLAISLSPSDNTLEGLVLPLINRDNDTQGFVVLTPLDLITSEDGAQTLVLVQLQQAPTTDVTLGYDVDTTQLIGSSTQLTFTPNNWMNPQALVVSGVDNFTQEGDRFLTLSWQAAVSADTAVAGLRPVNLQILHRDNDQTVTGGGQNLPPFRLILEASSITPNTLDMVTLTYGAEDPEEVALLRGGIVKFELLLGGKSAFAVHEHTESSQVVMPFIDSGTAELELRATDLLGAISTKKLDLLISSNTNSPFISVSETTQGSAPRSFTWRWRDLVNDPDLVQSIGYDFDGDGITDSSGLTSDPDMDAVTYTYDDAGQYDGRIHLIMDTGERFSATRSFFLSAPTVALPILEVSSSLSSPTAPSVLTLQAQWNGASQSVDRVIWNVDLDPEHGTDLITDDFSISLPINQPGSHHIEVIAILNDGRRVRAVHDAHIASSGEPTLTPLDERLRPFQTTLGLGHPLYGETWPPQVTTVSNTHRIGPSAGQLIEFPGTASVISSDFSSTRYHQLDALVTFDNQNWNLSFNRLWQVDRNFNASFLADPLRSDFFRSLWVPNEVNSVETYDGSMVLLPAQDIVNQTGTLTVTRLLDSGLNLQGVPAFLKSLERDVSIVAISQGSLEKPDQPIEIRLAYDDIDQDGLIDGTQVSENQLVCMRFDTGLNRWVPVEGFYTHPDLNVVRAKTYHLSTFGLFYPGTRTFGTENNSGGGCLLHNVTK